MCKSHDPLTMVELGTMHSIKPNFLSFLGRVLKNLDLERI